MLLRFATTLTLAFVIAAPALAAPKPAYGPPAKWVQVAEAPPPPAVEEPKDRLRRVWR